jgi:hypothetical protein
MLRAVTEKALQQMIVSRASVLGWRHAHVEPGQVKGGRWITGTAAGFPDLWLVRDGRLLVFEIKRERGTLRPGQQEWIDALDAVPGVTARIVRPSDIEAVIDLLL